MCFQRTDNEKLYAADSREMACEGIINCWASCHRRKEVPIDAIVSSSVDQVLLSWHDLINLHVIPPGFPDARCASDVGADAAPPAKAKAATVENTYDTVKARLQKKKFPGAIRDTLGEQVLAGPPMKIYLREDVPLEPKKVLTARQVPRHRHDEAKKEIERLTGGSKSDRTC